MFFPFLDIFSSKILRTSFLKTKLLQFLNNYTIVVNFYLLAILLSIFIMDVNVFKDRGGKNTQNLGIPKCSRIFFTPLLIGWT